jgi:putative ABC transport system substrate-binding protein
VTVATRRLSRRRLLVAGAATFLPGRAAAQQARVPVLGIVRFGTKRRRDNVVASLTQFMHELGWEEGRHFRLVVLYAEEQPDRIPALVGELVSRRVDVMVQFGDTAIRAAQQATRAIPIVGMADDIVGSRLAASFAPPGANTTGVSILASELDVKRLELLHEFVPMARRIGMLVDPTTVSTRPQLEKAALTLGIEAVTFEGQTRNEIARALDAMPAARIGAVNVLASPILDAARLLLIERLNRVRLPAIYQWPETAGDGGFLAYGPRVSLAYRHVAGLVNKILRGAQPADLPIEQPTKFELVINLKTAKALGLAIPASLLARADQVIDP